MAEVTLLGGEPVTDDGYREIDAQTGRQRDYVVLSEEDRAKGFVRPLRQRYVHETCGGVTTITSAIAETFARDPEFYSGTFCPHCRSHFPLGQFTWLGTGEIVGS